MKAVVVLKLPKPAALVCSIAQSIVNAMTDNPRFKDLEPALVSIREDIANVEEANAFVLTRTKGARQARDVELSALKLALIHLAASVQEVADADPPNAPSIIESAGMSVKHPSMRQKLTFQVLAGEAPGTARLIVKSAGDRASYDWQYSTDQHVWTTCPTTIQSSTVIGGLAEATRYYFRFRVTLKDGVGMWSNAVFLVTP
jgi:hypothetical protein